jgi:Phospholipid-translocating P-type ATPase C-terminal
MQAFLDAAICFFIPFLAASPLGERSTIDIFSIGKTIFICMLGVVTMEIMIVARYWTIWFAAVCLLSYSLVYPYVLFFPIFMQNVFNYWDLESSGVGVNIMRTPFFWIALMTVYSMTFSIRCASVVTLNARTCSGWSRRAGCVCADLLSMCRYFERSLKWLFRPDDNMILAELEARQGTIELKPTKRPLSPVYPVVEDPQAVRFLPCLPCMRSSQIQPGTLRQVLWHVTTMRIVRAKCSTRAWFGAHTNPSPKARCDWVGGCCRLQLAQPWGSPHTLWWQCLQHRTPIAATCSPSPRPGEANRPRPSTAFARRLRGTRGTSATRAVQATKCSLRRRSAPPSRTARTPTRPCSERLGDDDCAPQAMSTPDAPPHWPLLAAHDTLLREAGRGACMPCWRAVWLSAPALVVLIECETAVRAFCPLS